MDPIIFQYARLVLSLMRRHWAVVASGASLIGFTVLGLGMFYDPKYESSITIYADNKNVIRPLLEGQAAVTVPKSERIRVVQETMFSPRFLEQVVLAAVPELAETDDKEELVKAMDRVRSTVELSAPANNYIRIAYRDHSANFSYRVVNELANLFIQESTQNKRAESQNAYSFIDEQVKSYKNQLVEAENRLKAFEAANVDGVESQVNTTIARLRSTIEDISIDIEAEQVRVKALEEQLENESRYVSAENSARVYRERLAQLESKLATLRLSYRDEHPDVIDLKLQIQEVRQMIIDIENSNQGEDPRGLDITGEEKLNPLYEELSNQLSAAKVNLQAMTHRLAANQSRLGEEYDRRGRIAKNQAELSELTRDYSVTKGIYEDLLERKERARISMTLDLTGQGVTYKVLEPASFPRLPTGMRFRHFFVAGPLVSILIPLGLVLAWILFDPRVKLPQELNEQFPGIVLAVMPADKREYASWQAVSATMAAVGILYIGAAAAYSFY